MEIISFCKINSDYCVTSSFFLCGCMVSSYMATCAFTCHISSATTSESQTTVEMFNMPTDNPLHDWNWTDFGSKVPPSACVWYSRLVWVGSKWSLYRRSPLSHDMVIFLEGLHSPLLYEPVAVLPGSWMKGQSWMKGRSVGHVFFLISLVSLCILLLFCLLWRRVLATSFFFLISLGLVSLGVPLHSAVVLPSLAKGLGHLFFFSLISLGLVSFVTCVQSYKSYPKSHTF